MSTLADYGAVCEALADKKGQEIVGLGLGDTGTFADVFILATGNSEVHMRTLVDAAEESLAKLGRKTNIEGGNSSNWRLVDAGDVIVHVFSRKGRDFYKIEKLWGDAEILTYEYKE
ncbi:ribosomal silencing factor RsfS [Synergistales bacterium]|nr:ribosomal silencing factor RsfS [Synergistales bacterium]